MSALSGPVAAERGPGRAITRPKPCEAHSGPQEPAQGDPRAIGGIRAATQTAQSAPQSLAGTGRRPGAQSPPERRPWALPGPSRPGAPLRFDAPTLAAALGPLGHRPRDLTDHEHRILALLADGHAAAAIGERCHLSAATVKVHLRRAYAALGARNGAHAVALGHARGLLDGHAPAVGLSARRLEVLALVARGLTNELIGQALWLSEDGVKSQVRRLLVELGAANRPNLVHRGFCCGALVRLGDRRESA